MRSLRVCAVLIASMLSGPVSNAQQANPQELFDRLKTLAGDWQGRDEMDHDVRVTFRLVSNGSALVSELREHGTHDGSTEDMITMIAVDGRRVLATHYCSVGNQPRMAATASSERAVTFEFVDGTNLMPAGAGRMQRLIVRFLGADRHSEEWVYLDGGRETSNVIDLRRASF